MRDAKTNHFDESAANWDTEPRRVELAKAVGEAILRQVQPTQGMDVLDYGCGTGLLGLFLLPHVRSVTGADSSPGMLKVLNEVIRSGGLRNMRAEKLDLANDPLPASRYHMIVANMVMHHVEKTDALLNAFYNLLHPGGCIAIADLDTEPGVFHGPEAAGTVFHHGFDRGDFKARLNKIGFTDTKDVTAHVVRKPAANGELRDFTVFLSIGYRAVTDRPYTQS